MLVKFNFYDKIYLGPAKLKEFVNNQTFHLFLIMCSAYVSIMYKCNSLMFMNNLKLRRGTYNGRFNKVHR